MERNYAQETVLMENATAEYGRWLDARNDYLAMRGQVIDALLDEWRENLTDNVGPFEGYLNIWLKKYGPDEIDTSILIASKKYSGGYFTGHNIDEQLVNYLSGILRNRSSKPEGGR